MAVIGACVSMAVLLSGVRFVRFGVVDNSLEVDDDRRLGADHPGARLRAGMAPFVRRARRTGNA
jgi:hypothetical protein